MSPFEHRAVLYIGSESYDAPTITVLQGLHRLGWRVFTPTKPNINSWFCNEVVESLDEPRVDFALSNLHWGTRWGLYGQDVLRAVPKVLIDGDDSLPGETWRQRHARYAVAYGPPPEGHERRILQERRFVEPLGDYEPDVLFTAQKQPGDARSHYLPFGLHEEFLRLGSDRGVAARPTTMLYVRGPGGERTRMTRFLRAAQILRLTPRGAVVAEPRGDDVVAEEIADLAARDAGVHGYWRWRHSRVYFRALGESQMLVYAPPERFSWDSKRPWEAFAAGALVLFEPPEIDMSEYSLLETCPEIVCRSKPALLRRLRSLSADQDELERLRRDCRARVLDRFAPEPIARYFLDRVAATLTGR